MLMITDKSLIIIFIVKINVFEIYIAHEDFDTSVHLTEGHYH